MEKRHLPTSWS